MTHLRSCVPPRAHLFLRDVSPLGLKQFAETNHVAELATELFVFYAVLSSAVGKNPSPMSKSPIQQQTRQNCRTNQHGHLQSSEVEMP